MADFPISLQGSSSREMTEIPCLASINPNGWTMASASATASPYTFDVFAHLCDVQLLSPYFNCSSKQRIVDSSLRLWGFASFGGWLP